MDELPEILLTNDDGIDSPGIRALYDALSSVGNVTVVAPANDQSAVGRSMSNEVPVAEHELGYAVDGTPVDCVIAGLEAIGPYPDLVVSGCNVGANLGAYVLGRSGTVSAAVEAAFFEVPAIAVSLYVPGDRWPLDPDVEAFAEAARATRFLAANAIDAGVFEQVGYLNVNVPIDAERTAPMLVTRPSAMYDMTAEQNGDAIVLHDRTWDRMGKDAITDPAGTDRRAIADGAISVSPLTAPHSSDYHELLDGLVERYG